MSEPKPFASLSPGLLARKGAAKPAMRPQIQPLQHFHEATARQMEDLGWNDMGHDHTDEFEPGHQAEIVSLTAVETFIADEPVTPAVVREQRAIAGRIGAEPKKAPAASARKRRSALSEGRRAAFTLRLDAERHLRLRLACTVGNRSAQQFVLDALDELLGRMPELEALAAHVRKRN